MDPGTLIKNIYGNSLYCIWYFRLQFGKYQKLVEGDPDTKSLDIGSGPYIPI